MATASSLMTALSRAYVLSEARPMGDPELGQALEDVREIHEELGWQVIRVDEEGFRVLDQVVPAGDGEMASFKEALQQANLVELRLQEILEPEVLDSFLRTLQPADSRDAFSGRERFKGFEEAVGLSFGSPSPALRGMAGAVQDLFDASPSSQEWAEDVSEPEEALATPSPGPLRSPVDGELERAVRRYAVAPQAEKPALRETIYAGTGKLKESRALAALAGLLEILVSSEGGHPNGDAVALAHEIINPATASFIAARLGEVRDEEERARMIAVSAKLGREMALALADALGEARDRFQRRAFMDGMLAQGSLALEVAQGMVEDPRWFVVRNGVSILGEMGGEDAVSHLMGTLANGDARVRRETVLALAKLGGSDAQQLLQGMLDDPEAEVRAMACRAVGVLGVEKALKKLMKILEEEQDQEIQVECLQALGKIGDPGAVPLIEKRAVKSLFSRRSQEVRVAAYRALAAIGTPHARSLLEKALDDSDTGVRTVVQALLA